MAVIDYASPPAKNPRRFSVVAGLMVADVFILAVSSLFVMFFGDDLPKSSTVLTVFVVLAELLVPATIFFFVFLLGWAANNHWRSRRGAPSSR